MVIRVSTNLEALKTASDGIPLAMGTKYPQATIASYEDADAFTVVENATKMRGQRKTYIHRFGQRKEWFKSYSDYCNNIVYSM